MSEPLPQQLYALPSWVTADMQVVHADLISRMNAELKEAGADNTIMMLLVERIAFNYIVLRHKESVGEDASNTGFSNDRNQKEFNTFWLAMTQEFRRGLEPAKLPDAIKRHLYETFADAITEATSDMPEDLRNPVREKLLQRLETVG